MTAIMQESAAPPGAPAESTRKFTERSAKSTAESAAKTAGKSAVVPVSGIVDTGRQMITILQPAALREIADGTRTVS